PDGKTAYSGGEDAIVYGWDTTTGKSTVTLPGHQSGPIDVRLTADGKLLATAGYDEQVILWDAVTGKARRKLPVPGLRSFALAADGRRVVAASDEEGLRFWDVEAGRELRRAAKGEYFYALCFSPDGRTLGCGESGSKGSQDVSLRDAASGRLLAGVAGR